ncbi:MAG: hypothetical protein JWO22_2158 [Frankiales bacterium]|nr:hypothetical protein [Frankiales bacterium]
MPRRPPVGLLGLLLVAGCTGGTPAPSDAVAVTPVNGLQPGVLLSCADLKGQLPAALADGVKKRPAVPESSTTVAYGTDPAIEVRCGVAEGLAADDPYTFDAVRWAMHDTGATRTWTTRGLKVDVQVVIPDHFDAQAELLGAMAPAITSALTR